MIGVGYAWSDARFVRDAIVFATAAAISVPMIRERPALFRASEPPGLLRVRIEHLDEIIVVAGLGFVGAFFRPLSGAMHWEMPGTVWLFLTLGLGGAVGLLAYAMVTSNVRGSEFLALALGCVGLGAGMAGTLHLSPIVVCFIAGVLVGNLPGDHRAKLWTILTRLERPI
jgi:hypothetical protein